MGNITSTNFLTLYNILMQEQSCFTISENSEMLYFSVYSLNKLCLKKRFAIYSMQRLFRTFYQGLSVKKERSLKQSRKDSRPNMLHCKLYPTLRSLAQPSRHKLQEKEIF